VEDRRCTIGWCSTASCSDCARVAQWDANPKEFGSATTCYDRFREWAGLGVFEAFHVAMVRYYDGEVGVDLQWCSIDSATVKAPKGGPHRPQSDRSCKKGQ
jgi:transposase